MGENGGNFQITLPPLVAEIDDDNKWVLRKRNITQFQNQDTKTVGEYVAESSLYELDTDRNNKALRRNQFFFNNAISSNDLVLIRFETLALEKDQRYSDANLYFIDKSNIANRIYDMIGLVDAVSTSINPQSNDVSVNISGRDLCKLFLEDGTYFYALENSQGVVSVAGNSDLKNSLLSRAFAEKGMQFIGLFNFTSIEKILKFIIQQLANIQIVPNNLFSSYNDGTTDRRNKRFNEINYTPVTNTKSNYVPQFKEEVSNGIWQIVKLVIDKSVSQRMLADTSFSTAEGSLINFIRSACQMPLVQVYFDTYGDQYHLIVRKPPYDQKALISMIEGRVNTEDGTPETAPIVVSIVASDVLQESFQMDDTQVYSWYHLFPQGAMINTQVDYSTAILPALFFDEYAQVFGSRPFQQSHRYVPYVGKNFTGEYGNTLYDQGYSDMKFIVESNQHLPFTRKGTIKINRDRRIKVGNIIRYEPTGEIFFVDQVQQSFEINEGSIDGTTTIQVSRGMIEQFIYGKHLQDENGKQVFVSYFNLIDTRLNKVLKSIKTTITEQQNFGKKAIKKQVLSSNQAANLSDTLEKPEMVMAGSLLDKYSDFPENKKLFTTFVNRITKAGYDVTITSTERSYTQQAKLNAENQKKGLPAAKPGTSKHEKGMAIDMNLFHKPSSTYYTHSTSKENWVATGVPEIAKSLGMIWGGDWLNYDRVHFEISTGNTSTETVLVDDIRSVTREITVKGFDESKVFSNFKVNKFTFNFFLKKLQFDPSYKNITSRQVYNSDQEGSLQEVIVTSKSKVNRQN